MPRAGYAKTRIENGVRVERQSGKPYAPQRDSEAITSDALASTPDIKLPPTPTLTEGAGLSGALTAQTDQFTKDLAETAKLREQASTSSFDDLLGAIGGGRGETERQDALYSRPGGVDETEAELKDINNQILREQEALRKQVERIQTAPGTATASERDREVSEIERVSLRKQADLSVIQLARQGKYDSAKAIADRAVAMQLEKQKQEIDVRQKIYDNNQDLFTKAEQRLFEAQQEERKRKFDFEDYRLKAEYDQLIKENDPKYQAELEELNIKNAGGGFDLDQENTLRKEFTGLKVATEYQAVNNSYNTISSAYQQAITATGQSRAAADQALIVAFNKMLDPTSVVREGEYARSEQGQSLIAQLQGTAERVIKGGSKLTDSERKGIVQMTQRVYADYLNDYNTNVYRYRQLAGGTGARRGNVAEYAQTAGIFDPRTAKEGTILVNPSDNLPYIKRGGQMVPLEEEEVEMGPVSSSGNRPQRNNNPGNVKVGGLGDQFALKTASGKPRTDEQGHLIFASPEDGLMALAADIDAKVSGRSDAAVRKLGRQAQTIADLNQVYAEDQNWRNNVVAALRKQGVSATVNSPLQAIPKDRLIRAIMEAEGFFA